MLLDIHVHTSKHSKDSTADPVAVVKKAKLKELQGIVITEHHYLWSDEEIRQLRKESEIDESFFIMAGQEVETDIGHVLVFGADKTIPERIHLKDLREKFPGAGLVWAHPLRSGKNPMPSRFLDRSLDAVEIISINHTIMENYSGISLWHYYKFTSTAGSDTHSNESVGVYPTQFDHPVNDISEFVKEIKAGRCRPFMKEIIKAGSHTVVTEITIGTKGSDEARDRLITRQFNEKSRWEKAKQSLDIREKIFMNGFERGRFRVPKVLGYDEDKRIVVEEGQRGKLLFELLSFENVKVGTRDFEGAALWLARLHNLGLKGPTKDDPLVREAKRMKSYKEAFSKIGGPNRDSLVNIVEHVDKEERILIEKEDLVQCHGDFHPKNIIVGQDRANDADTRFISVIDFDNTILMPAGFDVGYFLSQFENQFFGNSKVLSEYKSDHFLAAYQKELQRIPDDFPLQVRLFQLRANLSIASYLVRIGKGSGPDIDALTGRSLTLMKTS